MARKLLAIARSLIGAVLGGVLGHYTFRWIATQGFLAPVVPGAFIGLGCAAFSRHRSLVRGMLCGIAGLGMCLFSRWTIDGHEGLAFKDFTFHFHDYLSPITEIMIGLGGIMAFWLGQESFGAYWGREKLPPSSQPPDAPRR